MGRRLLSLRVFQHAPKVSNLLVGRVVAVKGLEAVGSVVLARGEKPGGEGMSAFSG
jgi:hypothetical protein